MKAIERFNDVKRTSRAGKAIYTVIKYGSKGLSKVNPITLALDAVQASIECAIAYFEYKKEKNKYKESLVRLKSIKLEYESKKRTIEESLKSYEKEIELIADNFFDEIQKQREVLQANIEIILELKEGLVILKELYLESNDLKKLEEVVNLQTVFIEILIK